MLMKNTSGNLWRIKFYDIKTKQPAYMEWADMLKGVPVGYIPYQTLQFNHTIILDDGIELDYEKY